MDNHLRVLVRVRGPPATDEESSCLFLDHEKNSIRLLGSKSDSQSTPNKSRESTPKHRLFLFDKVFGSVTTQQQVFDEIEPMVDSSMNGYTSTIFAYGPTGSGKTFSMMGTPDFPGIVPRAVEKIFAIVDSRPQSLFLINFTFLELYNDNFVNLLSHESGTPKKQQGIKVHRTPTKGVFLTGQESLEQRVTSAQETLRLVERGLAARSVSSTNCNERSSRSHVILMFDIQSQDQQSLTSHNGKLVLTDLAGSERISASGATGATLVETQHINSSLSALADVLSALSTGEKLIPYRNSKLTMLLQDALGGNSKTVMLTCIPPNPKQYTDISVALSFSSRAKLIKNQAVMNTETTSDISIIKRNIDLLKTQITDRASELAVLLSGSDGEAPSFELAKKIEELSQHNRLDAENMDELMKQVIHGSTVVSSMERLVMDSVTRKLEQAREEVQHLTTKVSNLESEVSEKSHTARRASLVAEQAQSELMEKTRQLESSVEELLVAKKEADVFKQRNMELEEQLAKAQQLLANRQKPDAISPPEDEETDCGRTTFRRRLSMDSMTDAEKAAAAKYLKNSKHRRRSAEPATPTAPNPRELLPGPPTPVTHSSCRIGFSGKKPFAQLNDSVANVAQVSSHIPVHGPRKLPVPPAKGRGSGGKLTEIGQALLSKYRSDGEENGPAGNKGFLSSLLGRSTKRPLK